jgi:hypothetical protein
MMGFWVGILRKDLFLDIFLVLAMVIYRHYLSHLVGLMMSYREIYGLKIMGHYCYDCVNMKKYGKRQQRENPALDSEGEDILD